MAMIRQLRAVVVVFGFLTLVTGLVYPLLVTGVANAAFPSQARGSQIESGGHIQGSRLIGQPFDEPKYFWGRLSATVPGPYNAGSSAASNLGPSSKPLLDNAKARIDAL